MARLLPSCGKIWNRYFLTSPFHPVHEGYSSFVAIYVYMACKVDPHPCKYLSISVFNRAENT